MAAERAEQSEREPGASGDSGPEPGTGTESRTLPGTEQLHQDNPLLNLPIVAIDSILGLMSYDEISGLRMVRKSSSKSFIPGPSTTLTAVQLFSKQNPARQELCKLQQQMKAQGLNVTATRREVSEFRVKFQEQLKQLQDQDQKILEQNQIIGEQNARLAELDRKLAEHALKHQQNEQKIKDLQELLERVIETGAEGGQATSGPNKRKKAPPESTASDLPTRAKRLRSRK
ncbi:F-box only protein 28-like [Cetorhinus maximus]